jgi:hypothetical protein
MKDFASGSLLALAFLLPPTLCLARECKNATASAPLRASVGGVQNCSQSAGVKVCAPSGKAIKSSSIRDVSASPNIDFNKEVKNADGGCITATVTVRARSAIGPPFLLYCSEGSYEGRVELIYCR